MKLRRYLHYYDLKYNYYAHIKIMIVDIFK